MRLRLLATLSVLVLAVPVLGACGEDDETTTTLDTTPAVGATGATGAAGQGGGQKQDQNQEAAQGNETAGSGGPPSNAGAAAGGGSGTGGGGGTGASCEAGYNPCVPTYPPDVDCPDVGGPISVSGSDPHGLDADGDGVGCET